jgi:hypothetical protein
MSRSTSFLPRAALALTALATLAGCASQRLPEYVSARNTLTYMHRANYPTIAVRPFAAREVDSLWFGDCYVTRGRNHDTPPLPPKAYAGYIRDALAHEIRVAGKLADEDKAAVTLSGKIDRITVSRKLPYKAYWNIRLTLTASTGGSLTREIHYRYDGDGIYGVSACKNTAAAFGPAVRMLVQQVLVSREFATLVGRSVASGD